MVRTYEIERAAADTLVSCPLCAYLRGVLTFETRGWRSEDSNSETSDRSFGAYERGGRCSLGGCANMLGDLRGPVQA